MTANQVCGTRHEALGLIWFRFCGSQFHAVAVSNELECLVWLNLVACAVLIVFAISPTPQRQSLFLHLWQSGITNGDKRTWQPEFEPSSSSFSFFAVLQPEPQLWFNMYQNIKCCFFFSFVSVSFSVVLSLQRLMRLLFSFVLLSSVVIPWKEKQVTIIFLTVDYRHTAADYCTGAPAVRETNLTERRLHSFESHTISLTPVLSLSEAKLHFCWNK